MRLAEENKDSDNISSDNLNIFLAVKMQSFGKGYIIFNNLIIIYIFKQSIILDVIL